MAKPPPVSLEFPLRDGTLVLIRPILPGDKDRLREGFSRLSDGSRYRRFGTAIDELTDEQVRYLTEIDYEDHMAWVALDPSTPELAGLGVARYVRLAEEPHVAEAAVTVVDSHHGRGLGTILLGVLGLSAVSNGIRTFRAYVLEENQPVLDILHELGARTDHEGGGLVRVDVPLPDDPEDLPDNPTGRVFKAVARRLLPAPEPGHPRLSPER
ncbi:MAG: GNAT family N-acetyltransferase [Actinobacteria bacterium]|nr:GNAT family N-acetyltransferase [Actinomycetota bacterium]